MEKLLSPFDNEQVASLNAFQVDSAFKTIHCKHCNTTAIASDKGLICTSCNAVVQTWAWDWMLNWEWKNMSSSIERFMGGDHSEFRSRFRKQLKGK